jgi:hypothetical protein
MLAIIMREPRVVGVVGLDAAGRARASRQGIRQFVVGTGGADLLGFAAAKPNSQRRLAGVHVFAWNRPAIRCYEKAGFREIGRRRGGAVCMGRRFDVVIMDAVAEEFTGSVLTGLVP